MIYPTGPSHLDDPGRSLIGAVHYLARSLIAGYFIPVSGRVEMFSEVFNTLIGAVGHERLVAAIDPDPVIPGPSSPWEYQVISPYIPPESI